MYDEISILHTLSGDRSSILWVVTEDIMWQWPEKMVSLTWNTKGYICITALIWNFVVFHHKTFSFKLYRTSNDRNDFFAHVFLFSTDQIHSSFIFDVLINPTYLLCGRDRMYTVCIHTPGLASNPYLTFGTLASYYICTNYVETWFSYSCFWENIVCVCTVLTIA